MSFDGVMLFNVLWIAAVVQVITLVATQKFKQCTCVKKSWMILLFSFLLNFVLGTLFTLTFTNLKWYLALWSGFFSFLGADSIYKALEEKNLLKRFSDFSGKNTEVE